MTNKGLFLFLIGFFFTLAAGWTILPEVLYRTEAQPMEFNHKIHTGDQGGLACDACHTFSDDGRFEGVPTVSKCAECHSSPMGDSRAEKTLVENYVTPNREPEWRVYARQPDNAYFSHATHVKMAGIACEKCHGQHGTSEALASYQVDRISGYSRDITGRSAFATSSDPSRKMTMDACVHCHDKNGNKTGCIECHK